MKNNSFKICILVILISISEILLAQQTPTPDGRRLREIIAEKYKDGNLLIGGTTGSWAFGTPTGKILDREFSYVTPENDFKQHQIHPTNSVYSSARADKWLNHIISKNQTLRMHGPIGPQCSDWAKNDYRNAAELEQNMRGFMQYICQRYNGRTGIEYMDVVNETVISGGWHKNKVGTDWENPWYIIGTDTDVSKTPLYIKYAFEIANEYAPDVKLIFNQHEGTINTSSWNLIKRTIAYLRAMDLRVDGIGWQAHISVGWEKIEGQTQALRDLIDWAHNNDLEFHVTEASVFLDFDSPANRKAQAETYKAVIDILVEKSANGKIGWNTWHIDDESTWRGDEFPALFDAEYNAKPAYYAVQLALEAKGDYTTPYEVGFQIKNNNSEKTLDGCKVIFNGDTILTDENGNAVFQGVTAGLYDLYVEKRFIKSKTISNLSIYSDTLFSVVVDSAEVFYNVAFHIDDNRSRTGIPYVNVEIDSLSKNTDFNGNTEFVLKPGKTHVKFQKENYKDLESDFTIQSDTVLNVQLSKSHAYLKFKLYNDGTPVNNALVVLNKDTLFSSSIGIATFWSLPVDSNYNYTVSKDLYFPLQGNLILFNDTTLNLEMTKLPTSIKDISSDNFKVYPNPVKDIVRIFSESKKGNLEIVNINGVVVKQAKLKSSTLQLNLSDFANGIYFIRCYSNEFRYPIYRKFIIQK